MSLEQQETCPKCKRVKRSGSKSGTLTAFMFQEIQCVCNENQQATGSDHRQVASDQIEVTASPGACSQCGKILPKGAGSITSFLLRDLSCRCRFKVEEIESSEPSRSRLYTRFQIAEPASGGLPRTRPRTPGLRTPGHSLPVDDSKAMIDLRSGDIIDGSYRLLRLIGQGGMGLVFLAEHLALSRACTVKFLAPAMVTSTSWIMFQNEAKLVGALKHPTICPIYDLGIHMGVIPFYAMEYLPGKTLEQVLLEQGTLSVGSALEIFIKLAEGLDYAHGLGIVHKDIKPANIMIMPSDDGEIDIKILDFGIAELSSTTAALRPEGAPDLVGTAHYMSPERFEKQTLDGRCDIYSLGCTAFETLTGDRPYQGDDWESLVREHKSAGIPLLRERTDVEFPLELEAVLQKMLAKDPEMRYEAAQQLADDLRSILEGRPIQFAERELNDIKRELSQSRSVASIDAGSKLPRPIVFALAAIVMSGALALALYLKLISPHNESVPAKKHSKTWLAKNDGKGSTTKAGNATLARILTKKAQAAFQEQRYKDMVKLADDAIKYGARDGFIYFLRGIALCRLEKFEPAAEDFRKAVKLNPALDSDCLLSEELAKCYVALGQLDKAMVEVDKTLAKPTAERLRIKGQILEQLHRKKDAIKCYSDAIKLDPGNYWCLLERGFIYSGLNQFDRAIEDLTKAIDLKPDKAVGYGARARVYEKLGKVELAKRDYEKSNQLGADWQTGFELKRPF